MGMFWPSWKKKDYRSNRLLMPSCTGSLATVPIASTLSSLSRQSRNAGDLSDEIWFEFILFATTLRRSAYTWRANKQKPSSFLLSNIVRQNTFRMYCNPLTCPFFISTFTTIGGEMGDEDSNRNSEEVYSCPHTHTHTHTHTHFLSPFMQLNAGDNVISLTNWLTWSESGWMEQSSSNNYKGIYQLWGLSDYYYHNSPFFHPQNFRAKNFHVKFFLSR